MRGIRDDARIHGRAQPRAPGRETAHHATSDICQRFMSTPAASKEFCQSLLCVEVPVVVTLARTSMAVENVLKLVPGVMIQFDKSCDSPLTVEVGNQCIAEGEVVKVGDKFGLRVNAILPHEERFIPLQTHPARTEKVIRR